MLQDCSPYLHPFVALKVWVTPEDALSPFRMVIRSDERPAIEHVHRYDSLRASKVAAIIPGADGGIVGGQDIVICRQGKLTENESKCFGAISVIHRSYSPHSYALLFAYGTDGRRLGQRNLAARSGKRRSSRMSLLVFYVYHLFQCLHLLTPILQGRRLFQLDFVDQYCKLRPSIQNICSTTKSLFGQLTMSLFGSSWKLLKTPKMKLLPFVLCASLIYRVHTLKMIDTCERTCTILYPLQQNRIFGYNHDRDMPPSVA